MGSEKKLFYSTGEVCRRLGIAPHVLRYWEKRAGLTCHRTRRGRRMFREEDIDFLGRFASLLKEGYATSGARRRLKGNIQLDLPLREEYAGEDREALRRVKAELERLRTIIGCRKMLPN